MVGSRRAGNSGRGRRVRLRGRRRRHVLARDERRDGHPRVVRGAERRAQQRRVGRAVRYGGLELRPIRRGRRLALRWRRRRRYCCLRRGVGGDAWRAPVPRVDGADDLLKVLLACPAAGELLDVVVAFPLDDAFFEGVLGGARALDV